MNMSTNMALKTRTRCYSFDQSIRECNESLAVNIMNKNCIIFPDRVISTMFLLLYVNHHAHRNSNSRVYTRCGARTPDHRREATLLLLLVLQSGAAVAVVWAHARTQELCL